jgi:hypothetical protein
MERNVADNPSQAKSSGRTRRNFLAKLGIGVAALTVVSSGLGRFGRKQSANPSNEFPGPDSIFHPAQDPRTDPRRS